MLSIRTDFSGASLGEHSVAGSRVSARLREEALVRVDGFCYDYNRHFAFGVENCSDRPAEAEVLINAAGREASLQEPALIYRGESPEGDFAPAGGEARSDGRRAYSLRVPIEPGRTVYLANYYFRPYERLRGLFDALADRAGARRRPIGATVEGRDLVCHRFAPTAAGGRPLPAVLITSGFHPPESDTVASEALMEYLGSSDAAPFRRGFDIYVVPLANPDGFVRGYNGCNAAEVNLFWQFEERDRQRCPEAVALWELIREIRPVVYVDFHGYTFQTRGRYASPYMKPVIFYEGQEVRRLARALNRRLLSLSRGHATRGILTYSPSMLASKITREYNTITYAKYHLHLRDGIARNRRLAVDVMTRILDGLQTAGMSDPGRILKQPHGGVRGDYWLAAARRLALLWGLRVRPALGRAKRWTLKEEPV